MERKKLTGTQMRSGIFGCAKLAINCEILVDSTLFLRNLRRRRVGVNRKMLIFVSPKFMWLRIIELSKTNPITMKKTVTLIFAGIAMALMPSCSGEKLSNPAGPSDIIPVPSNYSESASAWRPGADVTLSITGLSRTDSLRVAARINSALTRPATSASPEDAAIRFECEADPSSSTSPEAYSLEVTQQGVRATSTGAAGLFYGAVTLAEMLEAGKGEVIVSEIEDTPRLAYRGMMLDVSRNFRDTAFIRKQIDAMARLKLNNLHLHLTDGAGWRMEIKRYPRLTDYAAWRDGKTWKDWVANDKRYLESTDPGAEGGYYTQDELRDLVAYAADRYINIVPEIEMPGHSEEVTAAYPELACQVEADWYPDLCAGNDSVLIFLRNVLTEVMDVFPSKSIHIGGDEASKSAWRECAVCTAKMRKEGISSVDGLQSYLVGQVESFLNANGRDMVGWDEIMEGGLAPNATVMSWRGTAGGERAAADGHRVIMTPGRYCYLDGYQDAPSSQPEAIGGYLPLELAYSYNPTEGITEDAAPFIYGLQGNLFAEYIPTAEHAEYMLYPRMYAIAERAWSPESVTDYSDFKRRASWLASDMRSKGYNTFDIDNEIGNREEYNLDDRHLAYGAPVEYLLKPWGNYPANGELTLTDGRHGGWNYNDQRWQAYIGRGTERMDVVIDLGEEKDIKSVGADFMQICGPDVWMPAKVVISAGSSRGDMEQLISIDNKVERDSVVSFKNFGWEGNARARFIRYRAEADSVYGGVLFTDEIVVK